MKKKEKSFAEVIKEYKEEIKAESTDKIINSMNYYGHDPYYDAYWSVMENEIERRLNLLDALLNKEISVDEIHETFNIKPALQAEETASKESGSADYQSDIEAEEHVSDRKLSVSEVTFMKRAKEGIWVTQQGDVLLFKDMSESHIKNCIRMLENKPKNEACDAYIKAFKKELKNREGGREK